MLKASEDNIFTFANSGDIKTQFGTYNNLINTSNIFSTDYFNLFYSEKERTDKLERFIKALNCSTTVVGRGVDTYYSEKSYNNG